MRRVQPGWLVALSAVVIAVSGWLPWLTTSVGGGGRVSALGGAMGTPILPSQFGIGQAIVLLASGLVVAGAMTARDLSARSSALVALVVSVSIAGLTGWFYHLHVHPPIAAGFGLFIGAAGAAVAIPLAAWSLIASLA